MKKSEDKKNGRIKVNDDNGTACNENKKNQTGKTSSIHFFFF